MAAHPLLLANAEQPQRGQTNSHTHATPCASQKAIPGSPAAIPQLAIGAKNQSPEVRNTNMVQAMNHQALA
jgi:hypothetical protein